MEAEMAGAVAVGVIGGQAEAGIGAAMVPGGPSKGSDRPQKFAAMAEQDPELLQVLIRQVL